jgi:uncharacterized protein YegJ (DUF2314 family)
MALRVLSILFLASLSAGCSDSGSGLQPGDTIGPSDDPVTMVDADDPEMAAAEQQARDTLDQFIRALNDPRPAMSDFAVKHEFLQDGTSEHMWIAELSYQNGKFTGTLGNEPQLIDNVEMGQPVTIDRSEVEDWVYFDGEEMMGGYTAKLLMSRQ